MSSHPNLANGHSVQVRINDRGPSCRTEQIIDLSSGACARAIRISGTARCLCGNLCPRCEFIKASNFNRTVDRRPTSELPTRAG